MLPARRFNGQYGISDFFNDFFDNRSLEKMGNMTPAINVMENDKGYLLELAAPGMCKDDFKVHLNKDGNLVIEMEKTDCCCKDKDKEKEKKECRFLRKEFCYTKFNQTLLLPENADKEKNFYIDRYDRLFALSNWSYKEMVRSESGKDELKTVYTYKPTDCEHLGGDFLDVEWEFIQGTIAQLELQKYIEDSASKTKKMTIAICKDEPSRCLAAALNLEWRIYDKAMQVLVYNRYDEALIEQLKNKEESEVYSPLKNKLKAFGMASKCFRKDILEDSDNLAKEFHKVYNKGQDVEIEKLTDYWSNVYVSNTMWTKLRCVERKNETIDEKDIDILAEVEHNRWNIEKLIMSFRPLTKEEQVQARQSKKDKDIYKDKMAHLNICSNDRLEEIDKGAKKYDIDIIEKTALKLKDFEAKKK